MTDLREVLRTIAAQGWTVEHTRGGHLRLMPPGGGAPYFSGSTPSDRRAIHNMRAALRRRGAQI